MAWKILTVIAMLTLITAGWLGWKNREAYLLEVTKREKKQASLDTTNQKLADTYLTLARTEKELQETQGELDGLNDDIAASKTLIEEEEAKVAQAKTELQAIEAFLVQAKEDLKEAGAISEILPKIDRLKEEIKIAEMNIAKEEETLRFKQGTLGERKTTDREFRTLAKNQKIGEISPDFASSIRTVYNDWGFVVLNAGDRRGLYSKAVLDVKRGSETVGQLKVTNVEPTYAVADILKADGQPLVLRSGDRVVKTVKEVLPEEANPAAAGGAEGLPAEGAPMDAVEDDGGIPDFGIPTEIPAGDEPAPAEDPVGGDDGVVADPFEGL